MSDNGRVGCFIIWLQNKNTTERKETTMANNTYNVYDDAKLIYAYKQQYDKGKQSGDKNMMANAANSAEYLRKRMTDNGYGDIANQLKGYNTAQTKDFLDYYPTQGKSSFRDYLKGSKLVTELGYTPEEIDNKIGFNNATKEITFDGMNIGKADTIVNGVSYFNNDFLDGVVDSIASRSGKTPTTKFMMDKSNQNATENSQALFDKQMATNKDINKKFNELYGYSMDTNPFETEVGKSIMQKYDLEALRGRDNEVASGAGSNSGNIDSFSAANALRQQTAITAQGQQMVIADQAQRVNNVLATLSGMTDSNVKQDASMQNTIALQQNQAGRLFEEQETEKMNDHAINADIATITGYNPQEWENRNNPYLNDDGTLAIDPNSIDFAQKITDIDNALKTETDPSVRASLEADRRYLVDARNAKLKLPQYSKYANQIFSNAPSSTLARDQMDINERLGYSQIDAEMEMNALDNYTKARAGGGGGSSTTMTKTQVNNALKNGTFTDEVTANYNAHYGTNYTTEELKAAWESSQGYSSDAQKVVSEIDKLFTEGNGAQGLDGVFKLYNLNDYDKQGIVNYVADVYGGDDDVDAWVKKHTPKTEGSGWGLWGTIKNGFNWVMGLGDKAADYYFDDYFDVKNNQKTVDNSQYVEVGGKYISPDELGEGLENGSIIRVQREDGAYFEYAPKKQ